jgi:hypothetical protein
MLVVFPISAVDLSLAKFLADRIVKLGGCEAHEALIVSSWKVQYDVAVIRAVLAQAFKAVEMIVPEFEEDGWPAGPNSMFLAAADYLDAKGNTEPWFFCEADMFPTTAKWLDAFEQEYNEAGKPYMGVVNDSRFKNLETGEQFVLGRHMVGAGVYPADFMKKCKTIETIAPLISWDTHIGPEILSEVHNTKLIAHRWGCQRARKENGKIIMEAVDPVNYHDYSAPLPAEAVLVHGLKDDSLYRLYT